jgi:hypothetical protein
MSHARSRKRRSCLRKHRYDTHPAAQHDLYEVARTTGADSTGMHVYPCKWCGGYHVGHRPGIGGRRP